MCVSYLEENFFVTLKPLTFRDCLYPQSAYPVEHIHLSFLWKVKGVDGVLVYCFLFRATPTAHGRSQARDQTKAATASLHHSHNNPRFPAASSTYSATCSNARSLTYGARPGIEPACSQTRCLVLKPQQEPLDHVLKTFSLATGAGSQGGKAIFHPPSAPWTGLPWSCSFKSEALPLQTRCRLSPLRTPGGKQMHQPGFSEPRIAES